MTKLVTVAIPAYKRFDFLPKTIQCVAAQDYSNIELLVSDNGMNGSQVQELVRQHYPRPFRFRQNPVSVPIVTHFNQLLAEASGEYYVVLCDDDEISPNYVSELVGVLESNPHAAVAMARQEVIDCSGRTIHASSDRIPEVMTGKEFIDMWCAYEHGFKTWVTFLGRTKQIRDCGSMPEFPYGTHSDDALIVKLCLGNEVAFNQRCTFRNRSYEESSGHSSSWRGLAKDTKLFLAFLESDPTICRFANAQADQWIGLKRRLVKMTWETYYGRWSTLYRKRLSWLAWVQAGFALPFLPGYYRVVLRTLLARVKKTVLVPVERLFPRAQKLETSVKHNGGT